MSIANEADLPGPGTSIYEELESVLLNCYESILNSNENQREIFAVKKYADENLCKEMELMMVTFPLIVEAEKS